MKNRTTIAVSLPWTTCLVLATIVATPLLADPPPLTDLAFLPGDGVLAPAAGQQLQGRIATGDETSLLVWVDNRAGLTEMLNFSGGPYFDHHIGSSWDLYATRLDASGAPVEASPIIVDQSVQNQGMPEVAWNGTDWLIAYSGQAGLQCCPEANRYAARISGQGVLLDQTPITLATGTFGDAAWPSAVGSDGSNWLIVWTTNGNQVTGMRIAPDGAVLDPAGVVLYTGGSPGDYDIAFANGEYFVVWSSGGRTSGGAVMGRRFAPDLRPVGPAFPINLYSPSVGRNCRVASNGNDYFVVWWEDRYAGWSQLVGARVSGSGAVLDPGGLPITEAYGYTNYEPDVTWDGVNYVTVYDRSAFPPIDLFGTRVTRSGVVLDYDTNAIQVSTAPERQWEATVGRVPGGDGTIAVWRDARYPGTGLGDLFSAIIAPDGTVGSEQPVALGTPRQTLLTLVPNGAGYLAVFRSETGIGSRILAQRLDPDGVAIDLEPVEVASGGAEITRPSAAWSGTRYLIVWENSRANEVLGRRYSSDLTPLDPSPIAVMPGNDPDVAAVGEVFLVVSSYENPHEIQQIYSQRVRGSDGALLDPMPPIVGGNFARSPRVAAFPDRWIVTWQRHPTHDNPNSAPRANIVLDTGLPQAEFVSASVGKAPAVAAGETYALIAWDQRNGQTVEDRDIFARRILPSGAFADPSPFALTTAANAQFDAAVGWSGTEFVTAFGDFRRDERFASKAGDIFGTRVSEDVVLDPDSFLFSALSIPEMLPAAAGSGGVFLLGGSVFRDEIGYASFRIGLRGTVGTTAAPVAAASPAAFALRPAQPNPFRAATHISLELPAAGKVRVRIHDAAGRLVRSFPEAVLEAGIHALTWDGRDGTGRHASPGVYFLTLDGPASSSSQRLVLVH